MTQIPIFKKKIKPNEICPCGSKIKYKKCHGSGVDQIVNPYQLDSHIRSLSPASQCLAPSAFVHECSKGIINAHTISRSGSLGAIEKNGHVYSYNVSLQSLIKSSGQIHPEVTGWRKASTFPGFCGNHDKKLFEPLEDKPFVGSKEQCFLLAFRCIARELYTKKSSEKQSKLRVALSNKFPEKAQFIADFNHGVDLGLHDSNVHKVSFDAVLESKNWSDVHAVLVEFDGIFPIQCACGYFPDIDIFGNKIQEIGFDKLTPDAITLVSFAANEKSYVSFCWLNNSNTSCDTFISTLLKAPKNDLPAIIGCLLLQVSENCHFSPTWYENLSPDGKKWCSEQIKVGISIFETIPPPAQNGGNSYFNGVTISSINIVS